MYSFETERLQMRPFTKEDKNEFVNICIDSEVKKYFDIGYNTSDIADFFDCLDLYSKIDVIFAILYKECIVGFISYYILPPHDVRLEYAIGKKYRGNGFATEALDGLLEYIRKHYSKINQGILLIDPNNKISLKVIEKYDPKKDHDVYTIKF